MRVRDGACLGRPGIEDAARRTLLLHGVPTPGTVRAQPDGEKHDEDAPMGLRSNTQIRPRWARTISLQIAKPSPAP